MRSTLESLIRVQQLDKRLLILRRRLESLPAELGERESHYAAVEAEADQADGERKAALGQAQEYENDVRAREVRIAKFEKQALEARDPSTVQVARHEAHRLREEVSRLQEDALQMLEAAEAAEARRDATRLRVDAMAEELGLFRANVERDQAEVGGEADRLAAERATMLGGVELAARQAYETLSEKHPGRAVAPVRGDGCGGCGTRVVPNDAVRVRAMTAVVRCPSCQRILVPQDVWSAAEESAAEA